MADGVFISERLSTECVLDNLNQKTTKSKRSRNRYLRRKRSKRHYRKTVKEARIRRNSTNLFAEVSVYDFTGMAADQCYPDLPKEVSDWQYYHQLAYWKSRAVSLEFENKMLHEHLKKMCTKEIQDYVDYARGNFESPACEDSSAAEDREEALLNAETPAGDLNLYGEAGSKIRAMEMAMDVNFKMQVDNKKPVMWPNIPLNL